MSSDPVDYRFPCLDDTTPSRGKIYLPSDVHPSVWLGSGSVVWRFAVLLEGSRLEDDVVVGNGCFLGRNVRIGAHTRLHSGVALPDDAVIGSYVYLGPYVVLANVKLPNLRHREEETRRPPVIHDEAVVGAHAVILPGVVIGQGAVVGAGAIVTRDVAPGVTVAGNPARPLLKAQRRLMLMHEAGEVLHDAPH
jgi:UDP-2-acetamido-3-amino-2,3-dideoxy-glucuronate N-acetyltransferase